MRLSATHFRVLTVVAKHDRMAGAIKKGQGCWASVKTLSKEANTNYTNFSSALNELIRWGYVTCNSGPRGTRVYNLVYDAVPLPAGKTESLPTGKSRRNGAFASVAPRLCPDEKLQPPNQEVAAGNILGITPINSAEAATDSAQPGKEGSSIEEQRIDSSQRIALVESWVKSGIIRTLNGYFLGLAREHLTKILQDEDDAQIRTQTSQLLAKIGHRS